MDNRKLIELLKGTIDHNQRHQAELQLAQVEQIIGFTPSLLQIVMANDVPQPVRQAGVILLKNFMNQHWPDREQEAGEPLVFSIHEQDRAMIRDAIIEATVQAPELIRIQLATCVKTIVKHDFPGRWTQIVDKISIYLQNPDTVGWTGALLCLYQLVKNFEYSTHEERAPFLEAMNLLLPLVYNVMVTLLPDNSEQSVLLQKQILKNFFGLIQYSLPLDLITKETFPQWVEILYAIIDKPVPESTLQVEEEERVDLPWWKCKKWAVHILQRVFERYGSPGNVRKEYSEFAEWHLSTFTGKILEVLLKILDQYRNKVYISPRVLQQTLTYIDQGVCHAHSWKFLKPHMFAIIRDVLFPLMSYSAADEELWNTDPHEYIRMKFDIFEDFVSPVTAAKTLLLSCCKKRKDMLQHTMHFCMRVLTGQEETGPHQKDGVLHMVGTLSDLLLKKKLYKDQMDSLLTQYVFPEFSSPQGHMRARACWVLRYFAEIKFKNEQVLMEAVRLTVNALLKDPDLPVKVEAAIALQMLLGSQEKTQKYVEPQINGITLELLTIIRETKNDDLTNVMQKLVRIYTEQLTPIAVDICEHLAGTFSQVLETESDSDEKAITAMGLLNTIEVLLHTMEESPEIMMRLESIVLRVVGHILQNSVIEFYEEALSLVCDLTSKTISQDMWKVLELLYQIFQKDGFDFFTDMMPALHNYVVIDPEAFLSNENHIYAMFNMCKAVLTGDTDEDPECYAAKLLEVIILQCKGKIDQCIPSFVELALGRLTREIKSSELRTMCLQVVIAALYYNPQLLVNVMEKIQLAVTTPSITAHFIKQWIHDTDCFLGLHDRKLCVLGLCTILAMGPSRPPLLEECVPQIVPSFLVLFSGLKRAYASRAEEEEEESDEEDESDEDEIVLSSDEDEIDEHNAEYLENLAKSTIKNAAAQNISLTANVTQDYESNDEDDDDEDDYDGEDNALESYTTPLDDPECPVDEYIIFKEVMLKLSNVEPAFYEALVSVLNDDQRKALQEVFVLADQRKAQQESKRIEQSGGYAFTLPASVPTTFKFGS